MMDIRFWPSLQVIAYARVARVILYMFDLETLNLDFQIRGRFSNNYIRQIKEKVSTCETPTLEANFTRLTLEPIKSTNQRTYQSLPIEIQEKLIGVVLALGEEVMLWYFCHSDTDLYNSNFDIRGILSWYSTGIIDRFETARGFIRNEDIGIGVRFYFACKYYFEEDAEWIWRTRSETMRNILQTVGQESVSTQYWVRALANRTALDWKQISRAGCEFLIRNCMGVRYFFKKLQSKEMRYGCIDIGLADEMIHHWDLYYCLSQMYAFELRRTFIHMAPDNVYKLFKSFLIWPFQLIFLDVVNLFKMFFNDAIFLALVCVLFDKISVRWQDHAYVDILKRYWKALSPQYGNRVKRHKTLKIIIQYVLKAPVPFDIEAYQNFIKSYDTAERDIEQHGFQYVFYPWTQSYNA
ncbi:uncharacterized protein NPIL_75151 [Nephila pilipes]|uniref:Uncharacterized protein n=1 Tax=Nephila pilipes TaxID=299642 RepID=A0A8X6U2G0_NEPPI|nr:uncharacterized protein NPIL_75151 [Nephila pilipes]